MASSGEGIIETAALGRPFTLGMLYDCRKDFLVPAVTLWDNNDLQENTVQRKQQNSEFHVTASDSIDEKSESLDVSGSLKLSLLGGLVNVSGSAKYFQDTKKSRKQQRLTLQYKTTTRYESLTMSHLGCGKVSHPKVFEDNTATHVVTAILYGANAYFVFDKESSSGENKKQVEGQVKLMMDTLKFLGTKAEASFHMNEEDKKAVEKFSCTFHGDFHLPSNPSTFQEAINVYKKLPTLIGENGEHAVPVRVWLYPLVKLDSKAAKLHREISNRLITYSSGVIEHLNITKMRCNDLLKDKAVTTFNTMREKIETFMQNCYHHRLDFGKKLGLVLPSIRGGGQEESALADILNAHEKSPFNSKDLDHWLSQKGNESDTLKSFLKQLGKLGAKLEDNLDDLLSDLNITNIVSFTFTSVDQPDTNLVKQSHFLSPAGVKSECAMSDVRQNKNTEWLSADIRQSMRRQLQLFGQLMELTSSDDTKFIVASKYDERYPGACIFIYEDGSEPVPFIPPSMPVTPTISDVSYDKLTVELSNPDFSTFEYRVEFRMKQETGWESHPVLENRRPVVLTRLKPNTDYEIRATAVGKLGYAVSSDAITSVTEDISPPINVKQNYVKADSITLTWSPPEKYEDLKQYIIEYKEENSSDWHKEETTDDVSTFTLKNLKPNTVYCIRMCTDVNDVTSKPGEEIKTRTMKRTPVKERLTRLSRTPPVYLLKTKSALDQFNNSSHKTIMLVGATGSGKTTLINAMINYILGVDWEDKWRFKLVDEYTNRSQAHSQTSEVIGYQIHKADEFRIPYSLTIIDTPGFGDTRGFKEDKRITERIRQFFTNSHGIDAIDAVCFVVQAALTRLTSTQRYTFNSILSLFGKNIASNILTLVTFADGQRPHVLEAMTEANIPCTTQADGTPVHFRFNNSVLFANNTGGNSSQEDFNYMFWQIGEDSMHRFFIQLSAMETQSLTLTKQVLKERKQLDEIVEDVQQLNRKASSIMDEMRNAKKELGDYQSQMHQNEDFECVVKTGECYRVPLQTGEFVTNCQECDFTCHYPCSTADDKQKKNCSVMDNGKCTVCPGKCVWNVHFNMPHRWKISSKEQTIIHQHMKDEYEAAKGKKINIDKSISKLEKEKDEVDTKLKDVKHTLMTCLKRLKEIALQPDPSATPDYIDLLIESEKQEAKPGYLQRIQELQDEREVAVLVQQEVDKISEEEKEKFPLRRIDYF